MHIDTIEIRVRNSEVRYSLSYGGYCTFYYSVVCLKYQNRRSSLQLTSPCWTAINQGKPQRELLKGFRKKSLKILNLMSYRFFLKYFWAPIPLLMINGNSGIGPRSVRYFLVFSDFFKCFICSTISSIINF